MDDLDFSKKLQEETARARKNQNPITFRRVISYSSEKVNEVDFGEMYMYRYLPQTRKKLPYYDLYPCIITIFPRINNDGFYGLNLHYLSLTNRYLFLANLVKVFGINEEFDGTERIPKYRQIKTQTNLKLYKNCIKHYKYANIKTRIYKVPVENWPIVYSMNFQKFVVQK